jgi:hypothetical protein
MAAAARIQGEISAISWRTDLAADPPPERGDLWEVD